MSDQRETKIFHRLKDRIAAPGDRFERVENGIGMGWPDVNYCIIGTEGWIEIKAPEEPAMPETPLFGTRQHNVQVEQANWLLKQSNAGGIGWLFIATKSRLIMLDGKHVGQIGARAINQMTAHELEKYSSWRVLLPMLDPLRWADLRELIARKQ